MKAKYLDIFTDFGFKKIFGEEANKAILYQLDIINRHNQTTYYLGSKPLSILTFAHELKIKATTFCAVF